MGNIFVDYCKLIKKLSKEKIVWEALLVLWAGITAIFINLLTNKENLKDFLTTNLNFGELFFFLFSFGLLVMWYALQALLSLFIVGIWFFIAGFLIFLIYKIYTKALTLRILRLKVLFLIMILEFILSIVIWILWGKNLIITLLSYLLLFLCIVTAQFVYKKFRNKKGKKIKPPLQQNK